MILMLLIMITQHINNNGLRIDRAPVEGPERSAPQQPYYYCYYYYYYCYYYYYYYY